MHKRQKPKRLIPRTLMTTPELRSDNHVMQLKQRWAVKQSTNVQKLEKLKNVLKKLNAIPKKVRRILNAMQPSSLLP